MDALNEQLRHLAATACRYPRGSLERQRSLTELVILVQRSGKLWRSPQTQTDNYEEALQQTWLEVCHKIDTYDPQKASVITWINRLLEYRLRDVYRRVAHERDRQVQLGYGAAAYDPIDHLAAPLDRLPSQPPLLEEIRRWVEQERTMLSRVRLPSCPEIDCRVLILSRLPPAKTWEQLSQEFGVMVSTLSNFYRRECLPRLRAFAESRGYR